MGDVAIRANPTITIVIRTDKGKIAKIIKKNLIQYNKIPNTNPTMKNVFFFIKCDWRLLLLKDSFYTNLSKKRDR